MRFDIVVSLKIFSGNWWKKWIFYMWEVTGGDVNCQILSAFVHQLRKANFIARHVRLSVVATTE
jgi:hypothetical protein